MVDEFILVRRTGDYVHRGTRFVPSGSEPPPDTSVIEVLRGNRRLSLERKSLGFVAVAPSMPIKLIAPVSKARATIVAGAHQVAGGVTWGLRAIGADMTPMDGSGVVVAVLDTGVDRSHPAFVGINIVEEDFTGDGNGDTDGHGTHCAATIFGRDVDGMRIGIARGVSKVLIGKVIGKKGGSTAHVASAIQWALNNGAHVISMSLGIDFPGYVAQLVRKGLRIEPATSLALDGYRLNLRVFDQISNLVNALNQFHQPCVLIAASGNESAREGVPPFEVSASPPAVADGFISVAALRYDRDGLVVAPFSNTGALVAAPGVGIISAKAGGGLISMDGTSMAAPHVAGVAVLWAQMLAEMGQFSAKQFYAKLLASAVTSPLRLDFNMDAVGAGIVQSPESAPDGAKLVRG